MYRERRSSLPGAWVWELRPTVDADRLVLPDGCMDLIWSDGGTLLVAGPDTRAQLYAMRSGTVLTGLRFAPGSAPRALGLPAHAVVDRRVPLDDIWGSGRARPVIERIATAPRPGWELESIARELLDVRREDRRIHQVARLLDAGASLTEVADATGLSARQLRRVSADAFGYGPKMLARILRLQRSVALARAGVPFVDVALRSGYADQPHLARDVRAIAGVPLTELIANANRSVA